MQRSLLEINPPQSVTLSQDRDTLKKPLNLKKSHPSIVTVKENILLGCLSFDLPPASKEDINKIVKSLNANKATRPDGIPLKLIKLSANVADKYLTSSINHDSNQEPLSS